VVKQTQQCNIYSVIITQFIIWGVEVPIWGLWPPPQPHTTEYDFTLLLP